jgi:hypothetical protein
VSSALGGVTEGLMNEGDVEIPVNLGQASLYTIRYNVAALVHPKIYFQVNPDLDPQRGETPLYVLDQKIADAEAEVTRRLGARYVLPLAVDRTAFLALPTETQAAIREVTDMLAASKLLGFSHGANSPSDGEKYQGTMRDEVEKSIAMLLDRAQPPLTGLTPLDDDTDDARPAGPILANNGWDTGLGTGPTHPADVVDARLPWQY